MIDRSPYDGESEGDVDRFIEGKRLDGDKSLVVVHADVGIDFLPPGFRKCGIWWEGTRQVATLCFHLFDGRQDDPFFLAVPEQTVFPGVWVEPANGDPRLFAKQLLMGIPGQLNDFGNPLLASLLAGQVVTPST